ncbi:MAG: peptidoglycan D,D-transpeptidase FtsI family protein [Negativicutes bacterium]
MMKNNLLGNIRRTACVLMGFLVILIAYISYVQVIEQDFLKGHPLNRRNIEAASSIPRGQILDRNGEKLATSLPNKDEKGRFQREYPLGRMTAHIVGYDSLQYGKSGIESSYNGYLSGMSNLSRSFGPFPRLWQEKAGNDVVLTIDSSLQATAYQALGNHRGAVVVIDPRTGAILSMVSKPSFDPAELASQWQSISSATDAPLLNRATQGLYPPGSIIKVMVAEAALSKRIASPNSSFDCSGTLPIGRDYTLSEDKQTAHGHLSLKEALAVSCNITFGRLSLELGRNNMEDVFEKYGFQKPLTTDLQESACQLPKFNSLSDGDLAQLGIGQTSLLVTPLRMAILAEVFANHGVIMKPFLVQRVVTPDGTVIEQNQPQKWLSPADPGLANLVAEMMVAAVANGTGSAAQIRGIKVAGKTGTAENPHGASHAWFIGFAPADNPQIAVAVIIENGGSGGGVAAPVARKIFTQALQ